MLGTPCNTHVTIESAVFAQNRRRATTTGRRPATYSAYYSVHAQTQSSRTRRERYDANGQHTAHNINTGTQLTQ